MHSNRPQPSHSKKLTVTLFGKRAQLKNVIGNMILNRKNAFVTMSNNVGVEENSSFKIINAPDFFDENCLYPDQQIIDSMAFSYPGPDLFILAIDSENTQEERVRSQIHELRSTFGDEITEHLVVTLPDIESFQSLSHLKDELDVLLAIANENLASECEKWCSGHQSFLYDYKHYSQDVVIRRKNTLEKRRYDDDRPDHHWRAAAEPVTPSTSRHAFAVGAVGAAPEHHNGEMVCGGSDKIFNIVLLGLTGTGKSASANTILAAENSQRDPKQLFKSERSSMPITVQCEVKTMEKPFGMQVRVVDTPDFFSDQLENSPAHVEECKRYCQQGQCVVLLVIQLGRFTKSEEGLLEKLEHALGWKIRQSTIVLLTHGDDLKGSLEQYVNIHKPLRNIVELCGQRCHLFNNASKETRQVKKLIKKIPNYEDIFPKFSKKTAAAPKVSLWNFLINKGKLRLNSV